MFGHFSTTLQDAVHLLGTQPEQHFLQHKQADDHDVLRVLGGRLHGLDFLAQITTELEGRDLGRYLQDGGTELALDHGGATNWKAAIFAEGWGWGKLCPGRPGVK
jgi:hypothetical protein